MTWRTWMWSGSFLAWFLVMAVPMLVMLIPINLMEDDGSLLIPNVTIVGAFLLLASFHNWISVRPGEVRLGFFPIYWRTLDVAEINFVMSVEFVPMRDFAGWGIKGAAKSRNGILLGGNPSRGIMIETNDQRRYVLSFADAAPILRALRDQGCTLADGNSPISISEV